MRRTNKKGFTIVELVIVIAVIAILAAVLIPNISRLVKKANASADESLVRNLNTALRMDTEKHTTMTAALEAAYENGGFDVAKIVTKNQDNKILWDSVNDCFVYLNGTERVYLPNTETNKDVKDWNFFEIVDKVPALKDQKYSIYLTGEDYNTAVEVKVGFDAGKNENIPSVTYKNDGTKQDVIINTNGGALEVDAPLDEVYRYGVAQSVKITAVAPSSYHEYGKVVGDVVIVKGRIELAASAEVSTIFVSSDKNGDVKIDVVSGATVGTVAPTTAAAKEDVDAATTIPADAKLNEVISVTADFAGGLGTERSPYLIATAEQFAKIGSFNDKMKAGNSYSFKLVADINLSSLKIDGSYICSYFCGTLNGNGHTLITNDSLEGVFCDAVNDVKFENVEYKVFTNPVKLCRGISAPTGANIVLKQVNIGTVNSGDNVKLTKNEGLYFNEVGYDPLAKKWCDEHRSTMLIVDCYATANIAAESYNAVFVGAMLNNADVTVKDCVYSGQYYGEYVNLVQGNVCSDAPSGWTLYGKSTMTIENVSNVGAMYGTERAALIAGGAGNTEALTHTTIQNCSIGTTRALTDATLGVSIDANKNVVVDKATANTTYYLLTFVGGGRRTGEFTINSSYRFSIKIDGSKFSNGNKYSTGYKTGKMVTVEQFRKIDSSATFDKGTGTKIEGEDAEFWVVESDEIIYYVFSFENSYYHFETSKDVAGATDINSVLITAYDENGKPIAQASCKAK